MSGTRDGYEVQDRATKRQFPSKIRPSTSYHMQLCRGMKNPISFDLKLSKSWAYEPFGKASKRIWGPSKEC